MAHLLKCIDEKRRDALNRYSYDHVFNHLYFSDLVRITNTNWDAFQNWFCHDKSDIMLWLKTISDFRFDAHAKDIDEDYLAFLRVSFKRINESKNFSRKETKLDNVIVN